jgi:hypothetical protein
MIFDKELRALREAGVSVSAPAGNDCEAGEGN